MRAFFLGLLFLATTLLQSGLAQVPTQEQRQVADAQLNQVSIPKSWVNDILSSPRTKSTENDIAVEISVGHCGPIICGDINEKCGVFVTATREGEIIAWDNKYVKPIRRFSAGMSLGGLKIADNGCLVCIGGHFKTGKQELKVFDIMSGRQVGETLFAHIGYRSGYYGDAYRPTAVSLSADLAVGTGVDRSIWVARLSSFLPQEQYDQYTERENESAYTSIPLPQGSSLVLPRNSRFLEDNTKVLVTTQLLSEERNIMSPYLWDSDKVGSTTVSCFLYNIQARTWAQQAPISNDGHDLMFVFFSSKRISLLSNLQGNQELVIRDSQESNAFRVQLPKGRKLDRMYFDSRSQWLATGDTMFNVREVVAKGTPWGNPITCLALSHNGCIAYLSHGEQSNTGRIVTFEILDLQTGNILAKTAHGGGINGMFALNSKSGDFTDASGVIFDSHANTIGKHTLTFEPQTVSCSSDGSIVAFGDNFNASIFSGKSGRWTLEYKIDRDDSLRLNVHPDFTAVSPSGRFIALAGNNRCDGSGFVYDVPSHQEQRVSFPDLLPSGQRRALLGAFWLDDRRLIFTAESSFDCYNAVTKKRLYQWDSGEQNTDVWGNAHYFLYPRKWVTDVSTSRVFFQRRNGLIDILDVSSDLKPVNVASIYLDGSGSFAVISPDCFYLTSASPGESLHFVKDSKEVYPFEQFDLRLNRPDIVLDRLGAPSEAITIAKELRERRLQRMGVTEDMLKPDFHLPEIQFAKELPFSTDSRNLSLQIKATDSKYPLERLRVYVNDVPVNGKDGETLRALNTQSLDRAIPVNLSAGKNKIQVSVLNSAGAESLYATAEVNCTAPAAKPNLYLVAMGVSNYANPQFNLKYAAKDAEDLAAKLKSRAGNAYGEVKELLLKDGEVTKDSLVKVREFLKPATVDDSVVLFMAGHGLLDDKYDYYFGTSDMDFNNPAGRGIAFDDMDDILADLPSRKKSLLMDTCHAGELDADEKKVLAAADAASSGAPIQLASNKAVAVRSVGTRGMAVKGIEGAKGKSEWYERISGMFVDLRRGSGSTILSSSAGAEYAFESGEQKNGLFTYAVLEALDGKNDADTDKDGKVTMKELCESVKKRVQDLSGGKQTPNTRRLNLESDFPLATAGPLEPGMSQQKSSGFIR